MTQMPDMHKINPKLTDLRHTTERLTSDFLINHPLNTTHSWLSGVEHQIKLVILTVPLFLRLDLKIFSKMVKTWQEKAANNLLWSWRVGPEELQRLQQKLFSNFDVNPCDFSCVRDYFPHHSHWFIKDSKRKGSRKVRGVTAHGYLSPQELPPLLHGNQCTKRNHKMAREKHKMSRHLVLSFPIFENFQFLEQPWESNWLFMLCTPVTSSENPPAWHLL